MSKTSKLPIEALAVSPSSDIPLEGPAADLYASVKAKWELTIVHERLLRLACESIQCANQAAAIVAKEGMTVNSRGSVQKHPCCTIERDARAHAAQCLQKLALALD